MNGHSPLIQQEQAAQYKCKEEEEEEVEWLPEAQTVLVRRVDPRLNYQLITNSLHLEFVPALVSDPLCPTCHLPHHSLEFHSKEEETSRPKSSSRIAREVAEFKYCLLVLEPQGGLLRMLGTTQKGQFHLGNLVAKQSYPGSAKKPKQNEKVKDVLFQETQGKQGKEREQGQQGQQGQQGEKKQLEDRRTHSLSCMNLGGKAEKAEELQDCELFVTKLQKEVTGSQQHRSTFFHEFVWNPSELQFIRKQVTAFFGDSLSLLQKRKYLRFKFRRSSVDEQFWGRWSRSEGDILFRRDKAIDGSIINFYVISTRAPLVERTQSSIKLFELPSNCPVVDLCIVEPWIAIAGESYLLFLHNYKPMEHFKHIDRVRPTRILPSASGQSVVVLHYEGFINCFRLYQNTVVEQKIIKIPFLVPHSLVEVEKGTFIAGVDVEVRGEQRVAVGVRKIHRISPGIADGPIHKPEKEKDKAQSHSYISVVELTKNKRSSPISHLEAVSSEILACSCCELFYLFNIHGHKLIEVQLKSSIRSLVFSPFPFNLFNFLLTTQQGQLIRIGIEAYGQTLGSELQRLRSTSVRSCHLAKHQGARFSAILLEGNAVSAFSYLKGESELLLQEQKQRIVRVAADQRGLAYLLDMEHFYEVKYFQF